MTAEEVESAKYNLSFVSQLEEAASQADLVIEAVPEKAEIKRAVFESLEQYVTRTLLICHEHFNHESDRNRLLWKTS